MTKEQSNQIKGVALLLMFWHHLFGCGWQVDGSYKTIFQPENTFVFGMSGRICISLFLFCSGYGFYKSYIGKENIAKKYIVVKLIKFLIPYWAILFFTICYLIYTQKFEVKYLFINLFALLNNGDILYVSFSWFIKVYITIILLLPLLKLIEKKFKNTLFVACVCDIIINVLLSDGVF